MSERQYIKGNFGVVVPISHVLPCRMIRTLWNYTSLRYNLINEEMFGSRKIITSRDKVAFNLV
jgi:hypothetical protein